MVEKALLHHIEASMGIVTVDGVVVVNGGSRETREGSRARDMLPFSSYPTADPRSPPSMVLISHLKVTVTVMYESNPEFPASGHACWSLLSRLLHYFEGSTVILVDRCFLRHKCSKLLAQLYGLMDRMITFMRVLFVSCWCCFVSPLCSGYSNTIIAVGIILVVACADIGAFVPIESITLESFPHLYK